MILIMESLLEHKKVEREGVIRGERGCMRGERDPRVVHRSRWKEADWTYDSDQMILIMEVDRVGES